MIGLVSFIVMFGLLVFAHELGHFVVAKAFGVRVQEFGFGYPPRLLKLGTWRGTVLSLNLLPLGGFVRMGEDDPTVEGSLATKSRGTRAAVYVAGTIMNLVLAAVLYSATFTVGALVTVEGPGAGIYYVAPRSPADMAGLRPGDTIVSVDSQMVEDVQHAVELIKANIGQPTDIVIRRDGKVLPPVMASPRLNPPPGEGALGVALDLPLARKSYPLWEAVPRGIRATYNALAGVFWGIRAALRRELPLQITGVIGIYNMTTKVAKTGLVQLLEFTAWLSINLFLVNLLPLPALDGGRLVFVLLEWVRGGRKIPPEKQGLVHAVGMIVLLSLMAVLTVVDYLRYFG